MSGKDNRCDLLIGHFLTDEEIEMVKEEFNIKDIDELTYSKTIKESEFKSKYPSIELFKYNTERDEEEEDATNYDVIVGYNLMSFPEDINAGIDYCEIEEVNQIVIKIKEDINKLLKKEIKVKILLVAD